MTATCRKTLAPLAALLSALLLGAAFPSRAAEPTAAWKAWLGGAKVSEVRTLFEKEWEGGSRSAETALGLAQALQLSGERQRAFAAAVGGLEAEPGSPFAFALLDMVSEDAAFDEVTAKLAAERLGALVARPGIDPYLRFRARWILLRLAPRAGDPELIRESREACGFPAAAFFTPPVERLTRLEFLGSTQGEDGAPPPTSAYLSELEGPQMRPPAHRMGEGGEVLYLATVAFRVAEEGEVLLYFNSSRSFRAGLDGKRLFERNVLSDQVSPTTLWRAHLSPGLHRITLKVHAGGWSDGVNFALLDRDGEPLRMEVLRDRSAASGATASSRSLGEASGPYPGTLPASDPRRAALDALYLRWQGDVASGRKAMEELALATPGQTLWGLWAARAYLFEAEDLPEKIAESRAERLLEGVSRVDSSIPMARFYRALLLENQTESGEDMLELKALTEGYPEDPRWGLGLASRMAGNGWTREAQEVLDDLAVHHPECGQVLWARVGHFAQIPDREREREAILRLERTGPSPEAWESYHASVGDWEALKVDLEAQVRLYGDRDLRTAKKLADAEYRRGRYGEARAAYEAIARADESDPGPALAAARCAFLDGDAEGASAIFDRVKARRPDAFQVDLARWSMGEPLPFEELRLPLAKVLEEDQSDGPEEAPSSLILDQQFGRVLEDGSSVERYHGVIRINDKEGVDREGEQAMQGQVVLMARTVKPDGTVLEPEQIPEKRTLSMPGLELGDLVEVEYITLRPPNRIREGTYLTSNVFLFQDIDRPFHRTQWYLEYPADLPMEFAEQFLPGPCRRSERGGLKVADYDYRSMPRIAPEPDTPHHFLYVPLVEVVGGVSWKDIALFLKDGILGSFQKTPELRAAYREAVRDAGQDAESRLKAIVAFSMREVEGDDDGSWQDPTQTLLNRQGSRLPLVAALLDLGGIKWELLVAEPVPNRTFRDDLPRLGTYMVPVLRVHAGTGSPRDLVFVSPYRATTPLPWYLQGARALPLTEADPSRVVTLGSDFSAWRAAKESEERTVGAEGDLRLKHSQEFDPDGSQMLRGGLAQIPRDQWEQVLQMALSRQLGSLDLDTFDIRGMDDAEKPFGWSYEVRVIGFASKDGENLVVAEPIPALHLSRAMASLNQRKLPLAPQGVTFMDQEYALHIPDGFETDYQPRSQELRTPFGSYSLEVSREGNTFNFRRKFEMPYQVVPPEKYPGFAKFLEEADRAEAGQMVLTPAKR